MTTALISAGPARSHKAETAILDAAVPGIKAHLDECTPSNPAPLYGAMELSRIALCALFAPP